jgi:hypothetical protein
LVPPTLSEVGTFRRNVDGRGRLGEASVSGSGVQGVDQLIQFLRDGLHVGLGERIGNRQTQRGEGDEAPTDVVEVVLNGLELAAHFARGQRRVIGWHAGIEDPGGHKQALVCFPSVLFYAPPPAKLGDLQKGETSPREWLAHACMPFPMKTNFEVARCAFCFPRVRSAARGGYSIVARGG